MARHLYNIYTDNDGFESFDKKGYNFKKLYKEALEFISQWKTPRTLQVSVDDGTWGDIIMPNTSVEDAWRSIQDEMDNY